MSQFLRHLQGQRDLNPEANWLQGIERLEENGSVFEGMLHAGEYGYSADLVDVETGDVNYQRRPNDAELLPFYFFVDLPDASHRGLSILERQGIYGIYTAFFGSFQRYFDERFPEFILDFGTHVPAAVLRYLRDGHLKRVRFISYSVPHDIADKVRYGSNMERDAMVEIQVRAKRNRVLPTPRMIRDILEGRTRLLERQGLGGEFANRIKLEFEYNGRTRTVDFDSPDSVAPYVDVTDRLNLGPDGHPVFDSISQISRELAEDIWTEMGGAPV